MSWRWPLVILLAAGLIYALGRINPGSGGAPLTAGQRMDFSLTTLDGRTIDAVNPDGGVSVVEFWATWCGPCVQMTPHLKQMHQTYRDTGLRMVSVSLDDSVADQQRFIAEHGMDWLHVNDGRQPRSLANAWGVTGIPHAFILSPAGELIWSGHPAHMDGALAKATATYTRGLVAETGNP